jgi:protein-S-isoprenylcysteine O-methyltransferase Ste14
MAAPSQTVVGDRSKEQWLASLMTPWVDRTIAAIAVIPFIWVAYIRMRSLGFDLPRVVVAIHYLALIGFMVTRKTPVRVSTNPWFWLLTFVETYWVIVIFAVMRRGQAIAPHWATDSISTSSAVLMIWARLSLGRSIGFVPALRSLVTHGAYRYLRHPIYSAACLSFVAAVLNGYSPRNLMVFALGIVLFALKSMAEEWFLRSDPGYAQYMRHVRWRWAPRIW